MQILQSFLIFLPLFVSSSFGTGSFPIQQPSQPFRVLTQQQPQQAQPRNLGLNALSDDQLWALVRICSAPQFVFPWLCSTHLPPIKCTLPDFCYQGDFGSEYVCERLPDDCLDIIRPGGKKKKIAVIIQDPNDNSTISPPDPDAFDNDPRCCEWARQRQCNENPFWMRQNCRYSCGTGEFEQNATTFYTSKVASECDPNTPQQVDNSPQCCQLAAQGQCDSNPIYMRQNCKRSCGVQMKTTAGNVTLLTSNVIPECRGGAASPGTVGPFGPPGTGTPLSIGGGAHPLNEINGRNQLFGRRRRKRLVL